MDAEMFLDEYLHWEVGVASSSNSSGDVPPSSPFGEEGGGIHDLPRPLTLPLTSGPTGRCLHHLGSGAPNQQGRDQGPVLPSVQAPKITRVPTMLAGMDRGIGWGCSVLLEELPEAERGPTTKRTRRV